MKVYLPSWNGDFRLEADGENSALLLHEPTDHERALIGTFLHEAAKKKWYGNYPAKTPYRGSDLNIKLAGSLAKTTKSLIKIVRPEKQTLTAVSFSEKGNLTVIEGTSEGALAVIEQTVTEAAKTETKKKPAAAVSVQRATPSCPSCLPGAIEPATEVLLAFLSPEEHESWQKKRAIVVTGGMSGHRYLLAHHHSELGQKIGRVCYDIDDGGVVHFHDRSVPPEEEILGAKLVLEHREPWLRNLSTCLGAQFRDVFENPFGHPYLDGTESAAYATSVGKSFLNLMSPADQKATLKDYIPQ